MKDFLSQNIEDLKLAPGEEWSGAVCFLLLGEKVVFIRRSEQMPTHKGQIAFFGGHRHKEDKTPESTALREFEEECGIESFHLEFLGFSKPTKTSRKHLIVPVVCRLNMNEEEFRRNAYSNGEWTKLLLVNISDLVDPTKWSLGSYHGAKGFINSIVFLPICDRVTGEQELLWGATGKIVFNAVNILSNLK